MSASRASVAGVQLADPRKAEQPFAVRPGLAGQPGDLRQAGADQGDRQRPAGALVQSDDERLESAGRRNWISSISKTTPTPCSAAASPIATNRSVRSSGSTPLSATPSSASTSRPARQRAVGAERDVNDLRTSRRLERRAWSSAPWARSAAARGAPGTPSWRRRERSSRPPIRPSPSRAPRPCRAIHRGAPSCRRRASPVTISDCGV